MYSYDRRKTAAKMDLHDKWSDIVDKHRKAEAKDMEKLLKSCVAPLKAAGWDLDLKSSYLDKYSSGSDGNRLSGNLRLIQRGERPLGGGGGTTRQHIESMLQNTLDVWSGAPREVSDGTWDVDISES